MIHILQNSPIKLYNSMTFSKFIELYNSMTFSIFIELFNHYHNQIFNIFITRQFTFTEIRNMFGSFTPTVFLLFDSAVFFGFTQAASWGRGVTERIEALPEIRKARQPGSGRIRTLFCTFFPNVIASTYLWCLLLHNFYLS